MKESADPKRKAGLDQDIAELDQLIDEILLASRLDAVTELEVEEEVDLLALAAEECSRYPHAQLDGMRGQCARRSAPVAAPAAQPAGERRAPRHCADTRARHTASRRSANNRERQRSRHSGGSARTPVRAVLSTRADQRKYRGRIGPGPGTSDRTPPRWRRAVFAGRRRTQLLHRTFAKAYGIAGDHTFAHERGCVRMILKPDPRAARYRSWTMQSWVGRAEKVRCRCAGSLPHPPV